MRFLPALLLICVHITTVAAQTYSSPTENVVNYTLAATLAGGDTIYGTKYKLTEAFLGIPYADPPVGPDRLKRPGRYTEGLDGFEAVEYGHDCIGMNLRNDLAELFNWIPRAVFNRLVPYVIGTRPRGLQPSEDCLFANVFRPQGTSPHAKLPVVAAIHGGGFQTGSSRDDEPVVIIRSAAAVGLPIVFVTFNYRLAGYGFLAGEQLTEEGNVNLGLLDQRLALEWVQDHIQGFGGDPDQVTLIGQSAGAMSVGHQLLKDNGNVTYNGRPLFGAAWLQSGSLLASDFSDSANAQGVFDRVADAASCNANANANDEDDDDDGHDPVECLRQLPAQKFRNAQESVPSFYSYRSVALSYAPRPDRQSWGNISYNLVTNGQFADMPMVMGNQEDEGTLFALLAGNVSTHQDTKEYALSLLPHASEDVVDTLLGDGHYLDSPYHGSPFRTRSRGVTRQSKRIAAFIGDIAFQWPRRHLLENNREGAPAWSYLGTNRYGVPFLGTVHGTDHQYMYHVSGDKDEAFAGWVYRRMLASFAYTRDPNTLSGLDVHWPEYGDERYQLDVGRKRIRLMRDAYRLESSRLVNANIESFLI